MQKEKYLVFAKYFLNNWGRGSEKYLLIYFDEKWYRGLLISNIAKSFEDIKQCIMKVYYKCHMLKTTGIAVMGFAFDDTLENRGTAIKMLFHRA